MAENLTDLTVLKRKVETLKSEVDQAKGALDSAMERLSEFGCSTIEEAEKILITLQSQADEAKADFDKSMAEFEEKWKGKL